MPTQSDSLGAALTWAAQLGPVFAFVVEALIVLVIFRSLAAFRFEMEAVDSLVSEYVRCRDFLLANRRASADTGWRTTETNAFREAWQNFNVQLGLIRTRHETKTRRLGVVLYVLLGIFFVNIANWMTPRGIQTADLIQIISAAAQALTGLLLWFTASHLTRGHRATIIRRTTADFLIAPWPADAGSPERQYSAFSKFLPVDETLSGSAPEVL